MGDTPSQSQLAEQFMATFNKKKNELNISIDALSSNSPGIGEKLTDILDGIQQLSKSLHDAVLFLPSYSVKVRQNEIRDLEKILKDKEDELIPKKKFGFKSKPISVPDNIITLSIPDETAKSDSVDNAPSEITAPEDSNFVTIQNLKDTVTVYDHNKVSKTDVLVRNLTNVELHLCGSPSTLRISNVKNCKILCGPVHTSVFVDTAKDSILFICCQQLRTHGSSNTDIYLRVSSRAIIEDCTGIRFAPYKWDNPLSKELHDGAQIDFNSERYDVVDDFNWLSATHSPNWSIIPEQDRISFPSL